MSGALVAQQPVFPTAPELESIRGVSALMARSTIIPEHFRGKPEDVFVALMTARGLGLDPMVALQKGYVVKGKFDIEVSVKHGMVLSRIPDFSYEIVENSPTTCTLRGGRSGRQQVSITFTIDQARKMGLTNKDTWRNNPEDMLFWRAMGRLLKRTCADALYNMPVRIVEDDDDLSPPAMDGGSTEVSGAEVIDDGVGTTPTTSPSTSEPDASSMFATNPVADPIVVADTTDWEHELMKSISLYAGSAEPAGHKNSKAKWLTVKKNTSALGKLVNEYYASVGLPAVKSWSAVPASDYKAISEYVTAINARVMENVELAAEVIDAEEPVDDAFLPIHKRVGNRGMDHIITLFGSMSMATKGERRFLMAGAKSNTKYLVDADMLTQLGYVDDQGRPTSMALSDIQASEPAFESFCRVLCTTCEDLRINPL